MSNFKNDLHQEHILAGYLDDLYRSKHLMFNRVHDRSQQLQGMDVIFTVHGKDYIIDEKAQLHYLNQDLPTFTFELSYLNKQGQINPGWLFDTSKKTDYYFLVTGIVLKENKQSLENPKDIESLKIMSVNRQKLINHLEDIGLTKSRLIGYDLDLRSHKTFGRNPIPEFKNQKDGCLYFTQHLEEQPINLQLRLSYLLDHNVAKKF